VEGLGSSENQILCIDRYSKSLLDGRLFSEERVGCGLFPLCKRVSESINYLFDNCGLSIRLWEFIKIWLGLHALDLQQWLTLSLKLWWLEMLDGSTVNQKAWHPSPCFSLGKFGTKGTRESFETSMPGV
jgi:hypothetical protein